MYEESKYGLQHSVLGQFVLSNIIRGGSPARIARRAIHLAPNARRIKRTSSVPPLFSTKSILV
jgi:hypothetical protein